MAAATPKLFMVLVGGHTPTSNLEVHDMRFVAGAKIEDTYEALRNEWWGDPATLHIDVWAEIRQIDKYNVTLSTFPCTGKEKLYFINLGGYVADLFDEIHKNVLVVETSMPRARARAKEGVSDWTQPHKDTEFEIEKILPLAFLGDLYVHLEKAEEEIPFVFHSRYTPISKNALAKKAKP